MDKALILMTRAPIPGKTKTRLESCLTKEQCAMLHTCFIKDIYETAMLTGADVFVYYTPEQHFSLMKKILKNQANLFLQKGDDLGARMFNAIRETLDKGYKKCVLIGTDLPTLEASTIIDAFKKLHSSEAVIGPTNDGGYYLIGMTRPLSVIFEETFYGTGTVYENTVKHMKAAGINFSVTREWYDIDTEKDLQYLIKAIKNSQIRIPKNTFKFLIEAGLLEYYDRSYEKYGTNIE